LPVVERVGDGIAKGVFRQDLLAWDINHHFGEDVLGGHECGERAKALRVLALTSALAPSELVANGFSCSHRSWNAVELFAEHFADVVAVPAKQLPHIVDLAEER
jgi:hypothetical protein